MKTFFRWTIRLGVTLFCLALVLGVIAVLLKDVIAKSLTEKNLRDSTGMDAKIAKMDIGLATPTVNLEGLKLYNTADFGGGTFLEMPELRVEYLPDDMRTGKLRFKTLRLNLSEVHIIRNKNGKTNLEMMHNASKKNSESGGLDVPGVGFGGVETIYLKVGKVRFTDERNAKNNQEFNFGSREEVGKNLKTEKEIENWFQLALLRMAFAHASTAPPSEGERMRKLLMEGILRMFTGKR